MPAKIIWAPNSLNDLREIVTFIAADNPPAALRMGDRIFDAADRLADFPNLGHPLRDKHRPNHRELVVADYRMIYRFDETANALIILRVWHGARGDPQF
ncbi:MAG TPA: type II toxin-antitoxin system RelE/ParE family toxin [Opitutaceae bacterium]